MNRRRAILALLAAPTGCKAIADVFRPAPLELEGAELVSPLGFKLRWIRASALYRAPEDAIRDVDAEFEVIAKKRQTAILTREWHLQVLRRAVIQLWPAGVLPSGYFGYTFDDPLQIDIAMDAAGYDKHFELRHLVGLGWLAHEWRHVLGERHL